MKLSVNAAIKKGIDFLEAGKEKQAEHLYQRILTIHSKSSLENHDLGVFGLKIGKHAEALSLLKKAVEADSKRGQFWISYIRGLVDNGHLEEANKALKESRKNRLPSDIFDNLKERIDSKGLVDLYNSGDIDKAEKAGNKLLKRYPKSVIIMNIVGGIFQNCNKQRQAVEIYDAAVTIDSNLAVLHMNRGVALNSLGRSDEAVESYKTAIDLNLEGCEVRNNFGNALVNLGQVKEAIQQYEMAIKVEPEEALGYHNIGLAFQNQGEYNLALDNHLLAISRDSKNELCWLGLSIFASKGIKVNAYSKILNKRLVQLLNKEIVSPKAISKFLTSSIHHDPIIVHALSLVKSCRLKENINFLTGKLSAAHTLLKTIELVPIIDGDLEKMLTEVRKSILCELISEGKEIQGLSFVASLSEQCFINEYLFYETEEESKEIKFLEEKIVSMLEHKSSISPALIMILAAYRPLNSFSWAERLLEMQFPERVNRIITEQIRNVKREKALGLRIRKHLSISDVTSKLVQNQYEENPYPRWVKMRLEHKTSSVEEIFRHIGMKLDHNSAKLLAEPDILIAGCGTGQHSITTASRFRSSKVLAIDLSLASLAYASRKTDELGISNIEYMQADILELGSLDRKFDVIESVGVLHHMNDPLAGLEALVRKLRTNGIMRLGLYSNIARRHITDIRKKIKKEGYSSSSHDIREFRKNVFNKQLGLSSSEEIIIASHDFYSISEVRDLLFHVQEHQFNLPEIEGVLRDFGLKFLGFEFSNLSIYQKFAKVYPGEQALTSLQLWHQFELKNPRFFAGMYQFWVQKIEKP